MSDMNFGFDKFPSKYEDWESKFDKWDDKKWDDKCKPDDKCDKKWEDKCDKKWDFCDKKPDHKCEKREDLKLSKKCGCLLLRIFELQTRLSDILAHLISHPCDKCAMECYCKTKLELKRVIKEFTECCICWD